MANNFIQNFLQKVTANQNPQRRDLISEGDPVEKLLQSQNDVEVEELTKNENYVGINFSPQLNKKFNRTVAVLYVEAEDNKYRVRGRTDEYIPLDTKLEEPPILSFSQYIKGHDKTEYLLKMQEFIGLINEFSEYNHEARKISDWLSNLQEVLQSKFNEKLQYLAINDKTDFEIPWEMLRFKNSYLGASLITVRWQDIPNEDSSGHIPLEFEPTDCSGDIIAYTNTKELRNVGSEKTSLEKFKTTSFEDVKKFLSHLENLKKVNYKISLIFIASHGIWGDDISQIKFGEIKDTSKNRSLRYLYGYNFKFFKNSPSIVFMNACHSGRLLRDKKSKIIPHDYRTGFATLFLKRGARGVIGILSQVLDEYAAKITDNFFKEYLNNTELSVAAILRNIRHEAAKKLEDDRTDENELLFISTFMYVYYGNPMTTLQLTERGE